MTRLRRVAVVGWALAGLTVIAACGAHLATASSPSCPPGMTCTGSTTITDTTVNADGTPSVGDALTVRDPLGNTMLGDDAFQLKSANPLCAITIKTATTPDNAHAGCFGGYPPLNATGGHPVLALCLKFSNVPGGDCTQWAVLTASELQNTVTFINNLRADGITVPMLQRALRKLGIAP